MKVIPLELVAHKRSRNQSTCFCWAIKPKFGPWEGYTSHDRALSLPAYAPIGGDGPTPPEAVIPAMRYANRAGVSPTAIATRLNLSQQAVDVSVLAFDPVLLDTGYYDAAAFEVWELNWRGDLTQRDVLLSGELGAIKIAGLSATVKLVPWHDKANEPIGRTCGVLCDVGRVPEIAGEEFGTQRCAGEWAPLGQPTANDGVKKANWTTAAQVVAVTDAARFRVAFAPVAQSGAALYPGFVGRLESGKVEFLPGTGGGSNAGQKREIKWPSDAASDATGQTVSLELCLPLPFAPVIGDALFLTSGCRRTHDDCDFYGNYHGANPQNPNGGDGYNFAGFYGIPGSDAAARRAQS